MKLDVVYARRRLASAALDRSAAANNVELCLLLPSAGPTKVKAENDRHMKISAKSSRFRTLATLHPMMSHLVDEVRRVFQPVVVLDTFTRADIHLGALVVEPAASQPSRRCL